MQGKSGGNDDDRQQYLEPYFNFYDKRLMQGQWETIKDGHVDHFFRLLAICNTAMPDSDTPTSGNGSSRDRRAVT